MFKFLHSLLWDCILEVCQIIKLLHESNCVGYLHISVFGFVINVPNWLVDFAIWIASTDVHGQANEYHKITIHTTLDTTGYTWWRWKYGETIYNHKVHTQKRPGWTDWPLAQHNVNVSYCSTTLTVAILWIMASHQKVRIQHVCHWRV